MYSKLFCCCFVCRPLSNFLFFGMHTVKIVFVGKRKSIDYSVFVCSDYKKNNIPKYFATHLHVYCLYSQGNT